MKKIFILCILFHLGVFAQDKEDKNLLLEKAEKELILNPEKSEQISYYIIENFKAKKSRQINILSYFYQNQHNNVLKAIDQHKSATDIEKSLYFSLLYNINLNPNNLFESTDSYYESFQKLKIYIISKQKEKAINKIIILKNKTSEHNKMALRTYWYTILKNAVEKNNDLFILNELTFLFDIYSEDLDFRLIQILFHLKQEDLGKANKIFETLPTDKLEKTNNIYLKKLFYDVLIKISRAKDEKNNILTYYDRKITLEAEITKSIVESRSIWFQIIENKNNQEIIRTKEQHKKNIWIMIGLLSVSCLLVFLYKRKKAENKEKKVPVISEKTENNLLENLKKFEQSELFLNNEISLTILAKKLNTNTKYLSETINTYKNKNFSSYINELRINYIIKKLKTEPIYRDYKIKYLAEVSGFSSHSLFASVFKNITTMSPNAFIKSLKIQEDEK